MNLWGACDELGGNEAATGTVSSGRGVGTVMEHLAGKALHDELGLEM